MTRSLRSDRRPSRRFPAATRPAMASALSVVAVAVALLLASVGPVRAAMVGQAASIGVATTPQRFVIPFDVFSTIVKDMVETGGGELHVDLVGSADHNAANEIEVDVASLARAVDLQALRYGAPTANLAYAVALLRLGISRNDVDAGAVRAALGASIPFLTPAVSTSFTKVPLLFSPFFFSPFLPY